MAVAITNTALCFSDNQVRNVLKTRDDVPASVEAPLPHANRSAPEGGAGGYRALYGPRERDKVAEIYRADIEAFGYEFE